ncbi:MAG: hypothetical protein HC769_31965 [Cyanobacteria bacterium CRU_2_1]|nr:hypothetical protein [Cyanobacteria bacterium CRU_2_1]
MDSLAERAFLGDWLIDWDIVTTRIEQLGLWRSYWDDCQKTSLVRRMCYRPGCDR